MADGTVPVQVKLQGAVTGRAGAGARYEVTAISAGVGNGLNYPPAVLESALPLFEGVPVFVDHAQLAERWSQTGGRSVRNVLGVLEHVHYDTSPLPLSPDSGEGRICGELRVYPGPDAEWFTAMVDQHLVDLGEGRASPRIGLSAVLDVESRGQEVVSIQRVVSVDAVYDPARGGEFIRALNQKEQVAPQEGVVTSNSGLEVVTSNSGLEVVTSNSGLEVVTVSSEQEAKEEEMSEEVKEVEKVPAATESRQALQETQGAVASSSGLEAVAKRGVEYGAASSVAPVGEMSHAASGGSNGVITSSGRGTPDPREGVRSDGVTTNEVGLQMALAMSDAVMEARLNRANLPEALAGMVRQRYGGRVYNVKDLDGEIEALQAAWAKSVAAHAPVDGIGGGIRDVIAPVDKLQAVMDQLVGLKPKSELLQGIKPVSGIRELYLMLSGDYDFRGVFDAERVALANITTSTMTSLVKNAFNKVILDYFNVVDRWWEAIVSQETFSSMQDLTLITLGGFGDLPTVAEGAAYTELSWSDSEEVVSFVKKGGYVGVTLEMMDKDETRAFRAIPRKLAIAGYRTLSAAIANLFTANSGVGAYWPSSQSTYRLFDSSYGNLGSSALSASTWDACIQAMYKMTEATSSERMGIRPSYLVVPIELEKTALTILESAGEPDTADNDINVRRGSSRVVVCPEMTDANDWLAVADPRVWPGMMVAYRFGSTPEVFIADQETVGSMFTNDEMRIKARYIFAVGVGDYRPLYKANV